jgi:hypothetical protein
MKLVSMLGLALALSGCNRSDSGVCGQLSPGIVELGAPNTWAEKQKYAMSCVEHWAARLARSKADNADNVAKAAVQACHGAIEAAAEPETPNAMDASPTKVDYDYWRRHAHFIAVQTRAGNCYPDA